MPSEPVVPAGTGAGLLAGVRAGDGEAVSVGDGDGDIVAAAVTVGVGSTVGGGVGFGGAFVGGGVGFLVGLGVAGGGFGVGPARTLTVRVMESLWTVQTALNVPGWLKRRSHVHSFCVGSLGQAARSTHLMSWNWLPAG